MSTDTTVDLAQVSANCAEGRHYRCLGTVQDGRRLQKCLCPVEDCGHGSDTMKARRRA